MFLYFPARVLRPAGRSVLEEMIKFRSRKTPPLRLQAVRFLLFGSILDHFGPCVNDRDPVARFRMAQQWFWPKMLGLGVARILQS